MLIDPRRGSSRLLDLDSLVVPGLAPPSVLGTPGYIAPEVLAGKGSPNIETDRHALAVLIYETLLVRHPLRGSRIHAADPEVDERLRWANARSSWRTSATNPTACDRRRPCLIPV